MKNRFTYIFGIFFSLNILCTSPSLAEMTTLPSKVSSAITLGELPAPFGWRNFCEKYRKECMGMQIGSPSTKLTPELWQALSDINEWANHGLESVSDMDHWGKPESWDIPTDGKADCEDFALLKRNVLARYGFSPSSLLMTIVYNQRHEGHAILTVVTDRGEFILDNQTDSILGMEKTGYQFVERQSPSNPNLWVRIGEGQAGILVSSRSEIEKKTK
jgi:predicted transglutaminase-like cysteine proteinase